MKIKKIICLLLSIITALGFMCFGSSCNKNNNGNNEQNVDITKAQLYVCNYNGGFGYRWLEAAAKRFTELNKETVFVPETKGLQIWIDNIKSGGAGMITNIASSRNNVYFLENVNYIDYMSQGLMMDISDIVTEKLEKYGESRSIAEKLTDHQQDYYCVGGKYYGLPHYEGFNGISYDADLFNEKSLYIGKDGQIDQKYSSDSLSAGVDGEFGTFDDGLPATYEEFFKLCAKIQSLGICPIGWSGMYQFYAASLLISLCTDYAAEEAIMMYDFDGTASKLVDRIDQNGNITFKTPTGITIENGYELLNHAGYYYALSFLEKIIKEGYYSDDSFNKSCSHTDAQDDFLLGKYESKVQTTAMLIEGCWWPEEAEGTFSLMQNSYINAGRNDRKIGFMPLPKATRNEIGQKSYLIDNNYCVRFINSNTDPSKIKMAKEFLQFCCTDESLAEYTEIAGGTLGYDYSIPSEKYNNLDFFKKSLYELRKKSVIVYPYDSSYFFYKNKSAITDLFITKVHSQPSEAMKYNSVSALDYFTLIRTKFSAEDWARMNK